VVAVMPKAWDLARYERVPVRELALRPHVPISAAVAPAVHQVAEEIQKRAGVVFKEVFCSESLLTSMNAAGSGLGFCFFSNYVKAIVPKGVVTRPLDLDLDLDPPPTLDLLFARRKDNMGHALTERVTLANDHRPFRRPAHCEN
jgi:DNA-binding transcriptional LysR family regulator